MVTHSIQRVLNCAWKNLRKRPDVWEISRIFSTVDFRRRQQQRTIHRIAEVFLGSMKVAHAGGAHRLVGMLDVHLFPAASNLGWKMRMIGLPAPYKEGVAAGIEVTATTADVEQFQERLGRWSPIAYEATSADLEQYGSLFALEKGIEESRLETSYRIINQYDHRKIIQDHVMMRGNRYAI